MPSGRYWSRRNLASGPMPQREDDISGRLAQIKEALGLGEFGHSGGQIHAFREGWATDIWAFGRAHYWHRLEENIRYVESECRLIRPARNMYGEGNVPRCKRCERRRNGGSHG